MVTSPQWVPSFVDDLLRCGAYLIAYCDALNRTLLWVTHFVGQLSAIGHGIFLLGPLALGTALACRVDLVG